MTDNESSTHLQFSGPLRHDDAERLKALLQEAVDRRPNKERCGAFLYLRRIEPGASLPKDRVITISMKEWTDTMIEQETSGK